MTQDRNVAHWHSAHDRLQEARARFQQHLHLPADDPARRAAAAAHLLALGVYHQASEDL